MRSIHFAFPSIKSQQFSHTKKPILSSNEIGCYSGINYWTGILKTSIHEVQFDVELIACNSQKRIGFWCWQIEVSKIVTTFAMRVSYLGVLGRQAGLVLNVQ